MPSQPLRAPDGRFTRTSPSPPALMSSSEAAITEEMSTLCESQSELRSMMQDLMARFNASTASNPLPPSSSPLPSTTVAHGATFVPPVAGPGLNGASSAASLSLRSRFPDVKTAAIAAIITHEFKAADLHKLDPSNRDKETAYTFNGSTNQFEVSHRSAKEYKTLFSVIIPLQTYFNILAYHINDAAATSSFFQYTAHLVKLVAEYEWSAIYDYHAIFFNRRRAKMASGDFSQWGKRDNDLLSEHVYAHRKVSPSKSSKSSKTSNPNEACRKFNDGRCTTSPCPWG
ncbi:hypothetical protein C0993_009290 [Termitomyces sp. T159_Od127]|nr:hypothetical protein C0993_009290 [Termitomyces sp. T159_Od127]